MKHLNSFKLTKFNTPIIAMVSSFLLSILKLIVGLVSGSLSIMTSAADSMMDVVLSGVNLLFIKQADIPPDGGHPFGHGKLEAYAALLQSIIIFLVGAFLLKSSITRVINKSQVNVGTLALGVMVIALVVSILLSFMMGYVAKREKSTALTADALHYKADLVTNGGILVSLVVIRATGLYIIDGIVAGLMALYIMYSAIKLHIATTRIMLDAKVSDASIKQIEYYLKSYSPYIHDFHNLRTRTDGQKIFADIHLTLCKCLSLEQAHALIRIIEEELKDNIKSDIDILIHTEICTKDCVNCCNHDAIIDFINKKTLHM